MTLRIDYTDRHEQHPASVKAYALEKAEKIAHFFDGVNHIQIVLDREHDMHRSEMIVSASHNLRLVGHAHRVEKPDGHARSGGTPYPP